MKVEVEISDELAHRLSYNLAKDDHTAADMIPVRLAEFIKRYESFPQPITAKHEAALAILRNEAIGRAVQCAKPGEGSWNIKRLAEDLLDAVLEGRG